MTEFSRGARLSTLAATLVLVAGLQACEAPSESAGGDSGDTAGTMAAGATVASAGGARTGTEAGEWRYWGGDEGSSRYSPLDQINADNAMDLEIAWRWWGANYGPQVD